MTSAGLWKCRVMENEENQNQVSLRFPHPWESLRDSHIPTATMTRIHLTLKNKNLRKEALRRIASLSVLQAHSSMRIC